MWFEGNNFLEKMSNRCQKEKLKNRVRIIGAESSRQQPPKSGESRAGGGGMKSKKDFCLSLAASRDEYTFICKVVSCFAYVVGLSI